MLLVSRSSRPHQNILIGNGVLMEAYLFPSSAPEVVKVSVVSSTVVRSQDPFTLWQSNLHVLPTLTVVMTMSRVDAREE